MQGHNSDIKVGLKILSLSFLYKLERKSMFYNAFFGGERKRIYEAKKFSKLSAERI